MRDFGERLRRAREEKGISLEEVRDKTKIRMRYLEALEKGDFSVIPGQVYLRGFIQNYATVIGLEAREILETFDQLRAAKEGTAHEAAPVEPVAVPSLPRLVWWQPALIVGLILLAALGIFLAKGERPSQPHSVRQARETKTPQPPAPQPSQPQKEGLRLVLRYSARCWVLIFCDGKEVFQGTVNPGTVQEWLADEVIKAKFGNAGAVTGELNGDVLRSFGAFGENASKEFKSEGP